MAPSWLTPRGHAFFSDGTGMARTSCTKPNHVPPDWAAASRRRIPLYSRDPRVACLVCICCNGLQSLFVLTLLFFALLTHHLRQLLSSQSFFISSAARRALLCSKHIFYGPGQVFFRHQVASVSSSTLSSFHDPDTIFTYNTNRPVLSFLR